MGDWSGIVGIIVVAAGGILVLWLGNSRRLWGRVDELTSRVFKLQDESAKCMEREAGLRVEGAAQKAEIALLGQRMKALESATGTTPPPPLSGIVVADTDGEIIEFSPALTPIFHWLPREVIGKPITVLMAPEEVSRHDAAFTRAALDPTTIDPAREILGTALTKEGTRVPVGITMRGWKEGESGFITATIRQRPGEPQKPAEAPKPQ